MFACQTKREVLIKGELRNAVMVPSYGIFCSLFGLVFLPVRMNFTEAGIPTSSGIHVDAKVPILVYNIPWTWPFPAYLSPNSSLTMLGLIKFNRLSLLVLPLRLQKLGMLPEPTNLKFAGSPLIGFSISIPKYWLMPSSSGWPLEGASGGHAKLPYMYCL